jgi:hypothetical protein
MRTPGRRATSADNTRRSCRICATRTRNGGHVSRRFDEYCEIVIGSDRENPSTLTSHDWHEADPCPWNQTHILQGVEGNGFWAVEVERGGRVRVLSASLAEGSGSADQRRDPRRPGDPGD